MKHYILHLIGAIGHSVSAKYATQITQGCTNETRLGRNANRLLSHASISSPLAFIGGGGGYACHAGQAFAMSSNVGYIVLLLPAGNYSYMH